MKVFYVVSVLLAIGMTAHAEEVTCHLDAGMVSSPADPSLAKKNRYHPGLVIPCDKPAGIELQIANEKLARKFEEELKGSGRNNIPSIEKGTIKAQVDKRGAFKVVTSYSWVEKNGKKAK